MKKALVIIFSLLVLLVLIFFIIKTMQEKNIDKSAVQDKLIKIEISTPAFKNTESIPKKNTCDGDNLIPSLQISNVPKEAKSLALIIEDPDAPLGTWDHFIMWNIKAENFSTEEGKLPVGIAGKGSGGKIVYEGPCPPKGKVHRYFFNLYALDTLLDIKEGSIKNILIKAMEGHVIGKGEMFGTYSRN